MKRITQHGEYLTCLTHFWIINTFLCWEDDGLTLIDTGIKQTAAPLMEFIDGQELPLKRILITHAHMDHVGGLDLLHAGYPEAEVIISRREAKLLAGDATLEAGEPEVSGKMRLLQTQTVPTRLLEPDEMVGSLKAIDTAGHSPGHMAFLDTRDNTLIAGDVFANVGNLTVAGMKGWKRWIFPLPHDATWHPLTALQAARELLKLEPTRIVFGHGGMLENPTAAMQAVIAEQERYLAQ